MANVLDPAALISLLPTLLPPSKKVLASSQDGITALLHAAMTSLAFRLIAVDDASSASSSLTVLPEEWNKNGPSHYTLRYKHDQSSLEFVLTISKLGGRTLINAIALESDKASSLDIATNDFVSPSFYPHILSPSDANPLIHGFISSNRVADLMSQFQLKIIQKLVPGLRKDGYTESADVQTTSTSSNASTSNPPPRADPLRSQPPPVFPGVNPYELPPRAGPRSPLEIGRRDLDPFPGMPANPFSPPPLFPGGGDADGMFVGPGHPIFGGGQAPRAPMGPWGGDGYLPPMGAPPGARFDPVGPIFPGGGFGRGRGGPRRFGGPDNDEFMPPGNDDMFM